MTCDISWLSILARQYIAWLNRAKPNPLHSVLQATVHDFQSCKTLHFVILNQARHIARWNRAKPPPLHSALHATCHDIQSCKEWSTFSRAKQHSLILNRARHIVLTQPCNVTSLTSWLSVKHISWLPILAPRKSHILPSDPNRISLSPRWTRSNDAL